MCPRPRLRAIRCSMPLATIGLSLGLGFPAAYALDRAGPRSPLAGPAADAAAGRLGGHAGPGLRGDIQPCPPLDVRSFPLLIPIAHSLVALPFVVRTLQPAIAAIPPSLRQAAGGFGRLPGARLAAGGPADPVARPRWSGRCLPSPSRWASSAPRPSSPAPNFPPCRWQSSASFPSPERSTTARLWPWQPSCCWYAP